MKIIKIGEDYLIFEIGETKYMIDIINMMHYVKYYYLLDCVVGDVNDLFEAIIKMASNRDMFSLIELFKHIKEKELGHKYLILYPDCSIDGFSDMYGLPYLFDIGEIIEDMIDEGLLEKYCRRIE